MRNIKIDHTIFDPANGIWDNYFEFVKARAGQDISEYCSSFTVAEIPHTIMYDRCLDNEASFEYHDDYVVMKIPTIYDDAKKEDKADSPFLETKHTITGTGVLKAEDIAGLSADDILNAYQDIIIFILGKYGDSEKAEIRNNDVYYNNKKVGGIECTAGDCVVIGSCLTMEYLPDKELIDSLPGRGNYEITGITEEIPELTKSVFIDELIAGIRDFFKGEQ